MKKTTKGAFGLAMLGLTGCSAVLPTVVAEAKQSKDSSELAVTVYKNDFALIHETRKINLTAGSSDVSLPGVSKMLDPASVLFDWPGATIRPEVVSTTYNLGVSSSQDILKRLVGQKVDIVWRGQDGRVGDEATGTLEESGEGTVLHTKDSYLIDPGGTVVAPGSQSMPTMPQLDARVNSKDGGEQNLGLSYLTRGLSWTADYVGVLAPDAKSMRLECWGTITNSTGTDFPHAKLRLIAGNPNRAVLNAVPVSSAYGFASRQDSAGFAPPVMAGALAAPVPTGELYAYNLPDTANVMQQQMNRARIFSTESVPIVRTYAVALNGGENAPGRRNATEEISFTNSKGAGLGLPLPSGTLRAYELDGSSQTYTGAAAIGDTPKGERISLTLSDAFDVYVREKQISRKRLSKHSLSETYVVDIYNDKKQAVNVRLADSFGMSATIQSENFKSKNTGYDSFEWSVPAPSSAKKQLTFTVLLKG